MDINTKVWIVFGIFLLFYPIGVSVVLFLYWRKYSNIKGSSDLNEENDV